MTLETKKLEEPATAKQIRYLAVLGHRGEAPATKGEAGRLIWQLKNPGRAEGPSLHDLACQGDEELGKSLRGYLGHMNVGIRAGEYRDHEHACDEFLRRYARKYPALAEEPARSYWVGRLAEYFSR